MRRLILMLAVASAAGCHHFVRLDACRQPDLERFSRIVDTATSAIRSGAMAREEANHILAAEAGYLREEIRLSEACH